MNVRPKVVFYLKRRQQVERKTAFKLFCENASIAGCRYITMRGIFTFERVIWLLVNILSLICILYVAGNIWVDWNKNPTLVTGDTSQYPVKGTEFPGISVCNLNKISRRRAVEFAKYLSKISNISSDKILSDIKLLGSLYDYSSKNSDVILTEFQRFLERYDNLSTRTDLALRLLNLSVPCEEILADCFWDGKKQECSQLFQTRLSDNGFCCIFNQIRPISKKYLRQDSTLSTGCSSGDAKAKPEPKTFGTPGKKYGLIVTLRNSYDDYFFTSLSFFGHLIQIFDPHDYPDKLSGSLKDIWIGAGNEVIVDLEVDILKTSDSVRHLNPDLRSCKFADEETTIFGEYSFSDCFVNCKVKSIMSLCGCVPFMLPVDPALIDLLDGGVETFCTLSDVPCLNRYKDKWTKYFPSAYRNVFLRPLQTEKYESIDCTNCIPECNSGTYKAYTSSFPFRSNIKNSSKVTIYYTKPYANVYRNTLVITWFEGISTLGGTVSLFAGVSIVSLLEVIVLVLKLLFGKVLQRKHRNKLRKRINFQR